MRMLRCCARARAGDHRKALAEARALVDVEKASGDSLYNLACTYALSSTAARKDESLAPAEREQKGEEYATRAIELLERVGKSGYFKVPARRKHLGDDSDLDALRNRDDYKAFERSLSPVSP
jgi:hypothetical protein